ncbi:MAG: hypothetical protein LBD50_01255 [Rickettsiales bacterium]|jgi:hypothetical protein|nr:hypothetical protein [Rickettsiales bacterium]
MKRKRLAGAAAFTIVALFAISSFAAAAAATDDTTGVCKLIMEMQGVFKTLRTLAFLGAGFVLAKTAWDFISTGKVGDKTGLEGLKTVGVPMLIGFALLFAIGVGISFLIGSNTIGCAGQLVEGWK